MNSLDHFSPDLTEFLSLLAKFKVRYLLVGGEAVIYYGYARLTGDIDLFYDRTEGNTEYLFSALAEYWDGEIPGILSTHELKIKGSIFQFGVPPNRIDLLNDIDGVTFAHAWENKVISTTSFNRKKIRIYYIGLDDLIRNKKSVGRNKDKDDIRFLIAVKKRKIK